MQVRRAPRRRHYLAEDDVDQPVASPVVDPWANPYPVQQAYPEQAYAPSNPLPVVQLSPESGVQPVDVAPFPDPGTGPMGYLEGLIEYALPALAVYVVLDEDAHILVRAAAGYAAWNWLKTSPVSPLNTRVGVEVPMSGYRLRGYSKSPCGCQG